MTDSIGLKISLPGYDVNSATPEQCSVHTSYDTFKIGLNAPTPLEGNILVTFQDTPSAGTYPIYTINHGYDYTPACYFFFDLRSSSNNLGFDVGAIFPVDALNQAYFEVLVDTPPFVQFNFVTNGSDTMTGKYFAFRYYVFAENGI